MENKVFKFGTANSEIEMMVTFVAEIIKKGLTYNVYRNAEGTFCIELTGGF
jgi:hypothetical protein